MELLPVQVIWVPVAVAMSAVVIAVLLQVFENWPAKVLQSARDWV